jgi:dTDP-4-amino-4,6-dideoxygalactose transaminase
MEGADGPWYYEQQELGFHYRLTDVQCALGISQLKRLDGFLARRRALASRYDAVLAEPSFRGALLPLRQRVGARNAYHLYVVRLRAAEGEAVTGTAGRRKRLFEYLVERGIRPQVHYIPVPRQPWYRRQIHTNPSDYPNAERYYAACLSLPLFPAMTDGDQERVVEALRGGIRESDC